MKYAKHLALAAIAAAPALASAQNTVTFVGEITDQTCEAKVNDLEHATVLMPTMNSNAFSGVGSSAGETPFTVTVTGCTAKLTDTNINTVFLGQNVTADGTLGNIATTNPAQGVSVQLLYSAGGSPIQLAGATYAPGLVLPANATATSHTFAARYYASAASVGTGAIQAKVEYTLSYL